MSNVKPPKTVVPRSSGKLLEYARIHAFDLKTMAKDVRDGGHNLDRPSVCAMLESRMLRAVEILEEIETYLRSHLPEGQLIAFPVQASMEAKAPAKKAKSSRDSVKAKSKEATA